MPFSKADPRDLYWALGIVVVYYLSLNKISGFVGGLFFFLAGWALPLVFLYFLAKYFSVKFEGRYTMSKRKFIACFIGFFALFSLAIDLGVYRLHAVGGDEGCMCMYFNYGSGRGREENYRTNIDHGRFFLYATESFIKRFHVFTF